MCKTFTSEKNSSYLWFLKPTGLNRGRGIRIFSTLEQLENLLNEYYEGAVEKILEKEEPEI